MGVNYALNRLSVFLFSCGANLNRILHLTVYCLVRNLTYKENNHPAYASLNNGKEVGKCINFPTPPAPRAWVSI